MGKDNGLHTLSFDRTDFYETDKILNLLLKEDPDLIILAGFLWKVPEKIVQRFPRKIINIHPALLPKYGGKGMYGNHVHQAVLANKEAYSGISIHYVNAFYDEGQLIAQFKTPVTAEDDLDSLKEKIQKLEHENFAKTIKTLLFPEN